MKQNDFPDPKVFYEGEVVSRDTVDAVIVS